MFRLKSQMFFNLFCFCLILASNCSLEDSEPLYDDEDIPKVFTPFGEIIGHKPLRRDGRTVAINVNEYIGIPFAPQPTRFAPPSKWTSMYPNSQLIASDYGSKCYQLEDTYPEGSENCLFLNIWQPEDIQAGETLPVVVFIHGGSFFWGSGADFPGGNFAAKERVIFVSFNYRLGVFGFYSSQATLEQHGTTGNWGMLDQRMAMEWVHDHISAFNGNPHEVTLMGESAGAFSVQFHLVSQKSWKFFNKVIIMSGGGNNWIFQPLEDAHKFYFSLISKYTKCADKYHINQLHDCIVTRPPSLLITRASDRDGVEKCVDWGTPLYAASSFGPVIDGVELTGNPIDLIGAVNEDGHLLFHAVPVILGVTADEGTLLATQISKVVRFPGETETNGYLLEFDKMLHNMKYFIQDDSDYEKFSEYASSWMKGSYTNADKMKGKVDGYDGYGFLADTLRDMIFHCPSLTVIRKLLKSIGSNAPVYFYVFEQPLFTSNSRLDKVNMAFASINGLISSDFKAFHSGELPVLLNNFVYDPIDITEFSPKQPYFYMHHPYIDQYMVKLGRGMACLFGGFVRNGMPGNGSNGCEGMDVWEKTKDAGKLTGMRFLIEGGNKFGRFGSLYDGGARRKTVATVKACNLFNKFKYPFRNPWADLGKPRVVKDWEIDRSENYHKVDYIWP
jgi:carboxylesterase type B